MTRSRRRNRQDRIHSGEVKIDPAGAAEAKMNAGMVAACCDVIAEANNASFQQKANTMKAVTINPSRESGKAIIQKICQSDAPSILAASSTSLLTSRKCPA